MKTLRDLFKIHRPVWLGYKDQTVRQALTIMAEKNVGAIIIVERNEEKVPIGIFSERDYARKVILKGKKSQDTLIEDVMTKDLVTVSKEYKIEECMELMTEKRIRHLPVIENGEITGIISIGDVLKIMIEEQKYLIEHYKKYIAS